jgi:hypothetical protein
MSARYRCYYNRQWPLDEYGRLGGLYSLVDLPIVEERVTSRPGIIVAKNDQNRMYRVMDAAQRQIENWVPMDDVTVGELINNAGIAEEPETKEFLTEDTK